MIELFNRPGEFLFFHFFFSQDFLPKYNPRCALASLYRAPAGGTDVAGPPLPPHFALFRAGSNAEQEWSFAMVRDF